MQLEIDQNYLAEWQVGDNFWKLLIDGVIYLQGVMFPWLSLWLIWTNYREIIPV
ncbi:hypothetical protein [Hydrocoleum sp. CS-953]|uniref:hypothetical protein n=1 Tax=Hydrocoleum sp. CS-953 TaxID=1671698 RepID=UPI00143D8032|nr:hypothetical protein [Hydrocoleum sp. CS-953]